jgi:DedD protein
MQKDQIDQGLSFKKRARRRLVGAIALVLLMVVILPMMLEDRENTVQEEDVEIIMPTQTTELETPDMTEAVEAEDVEELIIQVPEEEEREVVALPKVETEKKKTETKKAVESVQKKNVANVEDKKATAKKPSTAQDVSNDKYYVQIGVFSNPENIKKLQIKLDDLGYKSLTEKITTDTGVKTRLRTETFIGRNEAAIALENIKDAGLAGMVVSQK